MFGELPVESTECEWRSRTRTALEPRGTREVEL